MIGDIFAVASSLVLLPPARLSTLPSPMRLATRMIHTALQESNIPVLCSIADQDSTFTKAFSRLGQLVRNSTGSEENIVPYLVHGYEFLTSILSSTLIVWASPTQQPIHSRTFNNAWLTSLTEILAGMQLVVPFILEARLPKNVDYFFEFALTALVTFGHTIESCSQQQAFVLLQHTELVILELLALLAQICPSADRSSSTSAIFEACQIALAEAFVLLLRSSLCLYHDLLAF